MEGSWTSYQSGPENKDFNKLAQNIGSNVQKISQNALSLKRLVKFIGSRQDTSDLKIQRHQIQEYTKVLSHDTSDSLEELNRHLKSHPESREYKLQLERLSEDFAGALNLFQDVQRLVYSKEKEELQKSGSKLLPPPKKGQSKRYMDSNNQLIELETNVQQQTQEQILQEENDLRLIEEQEAAINQLETDIKSVNEIFTKLGEMVHTQGEIVDSIEANIETTKVKVSEGATNIKEAAKLKGRLIKRKICLIGIPLTVIIICFIILVSWSN